MSATSAEQVCSACRYFGLSFLLYSCLATPLLYKSYNFFNARGLWFVSTTQQNLWHTFFGSMVSSVGCLHLRAAELAAKFLSQSLVPTCLVRANSFSQPVAALLAHVAWLRCLLLP